MIPPRPRQAIRGQPHRPTWTGLAGLSPRRGLRALGRLGGVGVALGLAAHAAGGRLRHQRGPTRPAAAGGVVTVAAYRGAAPLLAGFLQHHRRLGLNEFVFLDLSGAADLARLLAAEPGCAVWAPAPGWRPGEAVHLLNALRHRYARGRWCLSLESTDLFVYHRCEGRRIQSLLDFVASEHRDHVWALTVDMYGPAAPAGAGAPLLGYFDPIGYHTAEPAEDRGVAVRGGPRRRAQHAALPWESPALDRVPLVKWRRGYGYLDDTSRLHPPRLNTPHAPWHTSPTGCLLRLALLDDAEPDLSAKDLHTALSRGYTGSADLTECGLLNPGQWF